jgi:inositol phosphorylceramide mannosyltransferase catalytic subunit
MALKNYLLEQPFLPEQTVQIINATELEPYLTDFEGASWHHGDTKTLMWIGDRPWVWFMLGAICLGAGLYVVNQLMLKCLSRFSEKLYASNDAKEAIKLM